MRYRFSTTINVLVGWFALLIGPTPIWAAGRKAPDGMRVFNVTCPAKEILPKLDLAYHRCHNGRQDSCAEFVALFTKVLPEYDCQRSFDRGYIVPALWLADAADEDYIRLLSRLTLPEAKKLFASETFRDVLDGALAEEFGPLSRQIERQLADRSTCPESLTGNISGVVVSENGPLPNVEVRYQMSGDATIVLTTGKDGSFSVACIHPAPQYKLCVGVQPTDRCIDVPGPNAQGTVITLNR